MPARNRQADDELHTALADLETQLAKGNPGEVRLTDDGELVIPHWTLLDDERDLVQRPAVADGGHLVNTCPIG
jgi:hypothetical protein